MRQRELIDMAQQMAARYGVDPDIFVRQIQMESGFNPAARNERTGATGLGQVMSATAQDPGYGITPLRDRLDPVENLRFSAEYMRAMLDKYDGDYSRALAAYNAGPGRVDEAGGVPNIEETQNYVSRILGQAPTPRPAGLTGQVSSSLVPVPRPSVIAPIAEQRNRAIRAGIMAALGNV